MSHHMDHLPGTFFGPSNLVELLRHRARCQAEDVAFTYLVDGEDEEVRLTYRELDGQARAIGAWLESPDLAGERALLLYPAGLEFIAAFFGCLYAGVVAVPVYPPRRNRSLERHPGDRRRRRGQGGPDDRRRCFDRVEPLIDETPHLKQLDLAGHLPRAARAWTSSGRCPTCTATRWPSCNTRPARPARPRAWCSTTPTCCTTRR